jgi:ankyrin repeat protein
MKSSSLPAQGNLLEWNSLIAKGDLATIQRLVEKGELSYKDRLGECGLSPLHLAAWHNQPEVCRFLISHKISPSIEESFSLKSPLHIAAYFGHSEVANVLLELGAKVTGRKARDFIGGHPMHYAALGEQEEMIFLFLGMTHLIGPMGSKPDFTPKTVCTIGNILDILIRKRNFALCDLISSSVGILIVETNPRRESTLYVGYGNENTWTPFHSAALLGDKRIVEMLVRKFPYAYCFCEDFAHLFDYSPADVALMEGNAEIAKILGGTKTVGECRTLFNCYSPKKDAPSYAGDLLKSISARDFMVLDKLINEHGEGILYLPNFEESDRGFYREQRDLTAISLVCRFFCFPFAEWVKKRNILIPPSQFFERDTKEVVFFNWLMLDLQPYATGFFNKVGAEIAQLS